MLIIIVNSSRTGCAKEKRQQVDEGPGSKPITEDTDVPPHLSRMGMKLLL